MQLDMTFRLLKVDMLPFKKKLTLKITTIFKTVTNYIHNLHNVRIGKLDDKYRLLHGLYGAELFSIFDDMNSFLDEHASEIVILDFQHMYSY